MFTQSIKVACRVQIWKKTFCQNSDKFCCSFITNDIMFMYLLYIYKKPIILSLFKIDTLNFTMYILANLTCSLKTYVRLHNLISINIFFTIKDHSFSLKRKPKTNRFVWLIIFADWYFWFTLLKTQTSLNPISMNIFFIIGDYSFLL